MTRAVESIKYHETREKHLKLAVLHIKRNSSCLTELQCKHETKSSSKQHYHNFTDTGRLRKNLSKGKLRKNLAWLFVECQLQGYISSSIYSLNCHGENKIFCMLPEDYVFLPKTGKLGYCCDKSYQHIASASHKLCKQNLLCYGIFVFFNEMNENNVMAPRESNFEIYSVRISRIICASVCMCAKANKITSSAIPQSIRKMTDCDTSPCISLQNIIAALTTEFHIVNKFYPSK